jgi:TRAP transporter 4TM/12TM fusion protein
LKESPPPIDDGELAQLLERFEPESPTRRLAGAPGRIAAALAALLSAYALFWVVAIVPPQLYRPSFLLLALVLTFLLYPARRGTSPERAAPLDIVLAAAALISLGWPILDHARLPYRAATPSSVDVTLGTVATLLVLEATRRTVGWILPATAAAFLGYAFLGPWLDAVGLDAIAHRGYGLERVVGTLYVTLEGLFGVPLDVAATYIALFTIYGAVLERSGAGRFFIDWAMAATGRGRSGAGPGRTVTLAGFLLGTVSGSGVATTVTLGSVAWPLLKRAGYSAEAAGAILSAGGIGAILSPPTLGAAAFLIAEFLKISYLDVLVMAIVPTLLYYLSILLMIEADARRLAARAAPVDVPPLLWLTRAGWHHFLSLIAVVALMAAGLTPFRAVALATLLEIGFSFRARETALGPRRVMDALEAGGRGVLSVAATTACAGIIVGVVTLTGLGLKAAGLLVSLAGGSLFLGVLLSAIAVLLLGLAVPVTASYIIAAVMIAPALDQVGVPKAAAHMFIFYYAVLSEVSPPTALAPFAAAALTGGNPFRTMILTWKYTLPAFLVPFTFALSREGLGLLLQAPPGEVLSASLTSALGIVGLAIGIGGYVRGPASPFERGLAVAGGLLLAYAGFTSDLAGLLLLVLCVSLHLWRTRG